MNILQTKGGHRTYGNKSDWPVNELMFVLAMLGPTEGEDKHT